MSKLKRLLSMFLAVMMIVMMIPFSVIATDIETLTSEESESAGSEGGSGEEGTTDETVVTDSTTIDRAFANTSNGTIKLGNDIIDTTSGVTSAIGNVVLDLAGYTWDMTAGNLSVTEGATLTIKNGKILGDYFTVMVENGGTLIIDSSATISVTGHMAVVAKENSNVISNGNLLCTGTGAAIQMYSRSNVIISGGTVSTAGTTAITSLDAETDHYATLNVTGGHIKGNIKLSTLIANVIIADESLVDGEIIITEPNIGGGDTTTDGEDEKAPDMSGDIINVNASNVQDVLDGKYGDITGKTINFTESITEILDLARPTKYEGSLTTYYKYDSSTPQTLTLVSWSEDISSVMTSHSRYHRTLTNVKFTADEGVTVAGFSFVAGHNYQNGYDYVRNVATGNGVTCYEYRSLNNIEFNGLIITGSCVFKDYMEETFVQNIFFENCTFTGTTDNGEAAIQMNADTKYFSNVSVKGCTISNYFQGVMVQGVNGLAVGNNKISNTEHNAIAIQSSTSNFVKGEVIVHENFITGAGDRAIRIGDVTIDETAMAPTKIEINNNIMVNSGDDSGQLIKASSVVEGVTIDLESNYWDGKDASTAVSNLTAPTTVGITGGTFDINVSEYVASGSTVVENADGSFSIVEGEQDPAGLSGTGTEEDPYLIEDLDDLKWFRDDVNNGNSYDGLYVKVTASEIQLDGEWTPIGNGSRSGKTYTGNTFNGTFNGNGCTIIGLTITSADSSAAVGLFGVVNGGTVQNIAFESVSINTGSKNAGSAIGLMVNGATADSITVISGTVIAPDGVGGVVGRMTVSGTISNCSNNASVEATGSGGAGGIVGKAYYTEAGKIMTISNCTNTATVKSAYAAGGIVALSAADVNNCSNSGAITATTEAGGIIGEQVNRGIISGNTNTADIIATVTTAGGIVGWVRYQTSTSDYQYSELIKITGNKNVASVSKGDGNGALGYGGIVGTIYNQALVDSNENYAPSITGGVFAAGIVGGAQKVTNNLILDGETVTTTNNLSTTLLENITGTCKNLYVYNNDASFVSFNNVATLGLKGEGTAEDPYLIEDLDDLKWFRDDVNNGNNYSGLYVKVTASEIQLDGEWTPIGYMGKTFKGNFNGNGVVIKDLVITKTLTNSAENNRIGFFGRTDSPAVIENITIENVTITGSLYVGAIVGHGYTGNKVENCTVKGNIAINAWWYAGVIGGNGYMNLVNNCHVIGNNGSYIKGNNGSYIGGIWGFRGEGNNQITNCTVTNLAISGVDRVGGISGIAHYGNIISDAKIDNITVEATDPEATTVGLVVGACQGNTSSPSVIEEITVENVKVTIGETDVTDSVGIYGTNIDGTTAVTNYVASIGSNMYESLEDAIAAAQNGETIVLLKDVTATGTISIKKSIILDLNGKTITGKGDVYRPLKVSSNNTDITVTIKNGTIETKEITYKPENAACILVYDGADVTLENVTLNSTNYGVMLAGYYGYSNGVANNNITSVIINNGTKITAGNVAIISQGSYPNTYIEINEGAEVVSTDSVAIYHPCKGDVIVNGGSITGATGIYIKAGTLTVNGGTIAANGEKADHVFVDSGASSTGDAIVIESLDYGYYGAPTIAIKGGTITSKNAEAVTSYNEEGYEKVTNFVQGGTFSSEIPKEFCAEGFEVKKNEDGTYGIVEESVYAAQIGDVKYATVAEALKAAKDGDTIILLADVTLEETVTIADKAITIDGDFTLTIDDDNYPLWLSGTVTLISDNISGYVYVAGGAIIKDTNTSATLYFGGENGAVMTFKGTNTVSLFNPGWYNHTIVIEKGASLELTSTGRMTVGYGNKFLIEGEIIDAKTADKTAVTASLVIPGGISITGNSGATFTVKNAYIKIGSTTTKPGAANGTFDVTFENSIADFTKNLCYYESTGSITPEFNVDLKNSVLNVATNLVFSNVGCITNIDNSIVNVGSALRNSGVLKIVNGSNVYVKAMIQFGENAGNNGQLVVDASNLKIDCSSEGHAIDGKEIGSIILKNGAIASITYIKNTAVSVDTMSTLVATKILGESTITVKLCETFKSGKIIDLSESASREESIAFSAKLPESATVVYGEDGDVEIKIVDKTFGKTFYIINMDTKVSNGKTYYGVGMFTGINSLKYKEVGFYVTVGGATKKIAVSKVYNSVTAGGNTITAENVAGTYIFGVNIWIPDADAEVTYQAYAIDLDGNEIKADKTVTTGNIYTK